MSWALWLAAPVVMTALAAGWTWLRCRPEPVPDTDAAMAQHAEYLDALVRSARSKDKGIGAPPS